MTDKHEMAREISTLIADIENTNPDMYALIERWEGQKGVVRACRKVESARQDLMRAICKMADAIALLGGE